MRHQPLLLGTCSIPQHGPHHSCCCRHSCLCTAPGSQPPLQSGFAGLYKLINLPVVPIAVNSGTLSPRKTGIWKSGTITYKVGEELPTGLPREEIEARVHAAINALN